MGLLRDYKKEIICDLAETYNIYDYKEFEPSYIYTLVIGLKDDSRFKLAYNGMSVDMNTMLNALEVDYLSKLWWSKTTDAEKGRNMPISIASKFIKEDVEIKEMLSFDTAEDFEKARKEILEKGGLKDGE